MQHTGATATGPGAPRAIPDATIARLPLYLRALAALAEQGLHTVSSGELADASGVNPAQLRKDLSHLGSYGTRGVGYDVATLRTRIGAQIGSTQQWSVVIVGMGNLGSALASYSGYAARGFRVAALVDASDALIGQQVRLEGNDPDVLTIQGDADLADVVRAAQPAIGIITTPAEAAQGVCDRMVAAGLTSILNFAPTVLQIPEGVVVRAVDLGQELQILAYHQQHAQIPADAVVDTDQATSGNGLPAAAEPATGSREEVLQ
ncbi:redox-sensing transcriptional repressor Rex [Auraticoccus sp. F435]|uniref:Redox-sensing transcriptional repressor Rex n=1 Tax=Auraticoccus cholistanensis TaxID=2656650 RepID=A0A6A9V194_9ACTN|nr:redox-sensing transcriptional repressor Rex [Auraticoccus cholistanensis]